MLLAHVYPPTIILLRSRTQRFLNSFSSCFDPQGESMTRDSSQFRIWLSYHYLDKEAVKTFLKKIGRHCEEYTEKFQDWNTLLRQLKVVGIPVKQRRWILNWLEKYRQGGEVYSIAESSKNSKIDIKRKKHK
jgi:hypothetical protein